MIDEQLAAAVKDFRQRAWAVVGVEAVLLLDPDPGQFAPLPRQLVARSSVLLLAGKQLLAGSCPLFPCSDLVIRHCLLSFLVSSRQQLDLARATNDLLTLLTSAA